MNFFANVEEFRKYRSDLGQQATFLGGARHMAPVQNSSVFQNIRLQRVQQTQPGIVIAECRICRPLHEGQHGLCFVRACQDGGVVLTYEPVVLLEPEGTSLSPTLAPTEEGGQ